MTLWHSVRLALVGAVIGVTCIPSQAGAEDMRLIGSGAGYPFPLFSAWFKGFSGTTDGVAVDYRPTGSESGIQDFINRQVDFAASDTAMSDEDIGKVDGGAVLLPVTGGQVVLCYNLPGKPKGLKLPRDVYPDIFLGRIDNWRDPRIVAANPDVELPDLPITVVVRSDDSEVTYVLTRHLSAISAEFRNGPGTGMTVDWPESGNFVAAPKNQGVGVQLKRTPGAIGYLEYGYAIEKESPTAVLENRSGNFVAAGERTGKAALASAVFPEVPLPGEEVPDLRADIDDPAGEDAYPIVRFSWLLFYRQQDPAKAEMLRNLVGYILTDGQQIADEKGYVPLPDTIIAKVREASAFIR